MLRAAKGELEPERREWKAVDGEVETDTGGLWETEDLMSRAPMAEIVMMEWMNLVLGRKVGSRRYDVEMDS